MNFQPIYTTYQPQFRYMQGYLNDKVTPTYPTKTKDFSITDILKQDSHALLDKAVNTALSVSYRVKIYKDTQFSLEEKWNELSAQIGELYSFSLGHNMNIERRKSMLEKERNATERLSLENKLQTWKDLNEPVNAFIDYFHKEKSSRLDQKILDG